MTIERRPGGAQYIPRPAVWAPGDLAAPAAHPLTLTVADLVSRFLSVRDPVHELRQRHTLLP